MLCRATDACGKSDQPGGKGLKSSPTKGVQLGTVLPNPCSQDVKRKLAPPEERQPVTAWSKTSVFAVQGVTGTVTT